MQVGAKPKPEFHQNPYGGCEVFNLRRANHVLDLFHTTIYYETE